MTLYGHIVDSETGAPLPGATVSVISFFNIPKFINTIAGSNGYFEITNNNILETDKLLITNTEYNPLTVSVSDLLDDLLFNSDPFGTQLSLQRKITTLNPVIVSAQTKGSGIGYGIAALLLLTMANERKKRAVGKIQQKDVITGGLAVAGLMAFGVIQKLLESIGIFAGAGNNQASQEQSNPYSPWKPAFYQASPSGALLITENQAQQYIDTIHDAFTLINDDFNAIMSVFAQLKTQSQVSYLAYKFAEKYSEDLLSFLRDGGGVLPWDGLSSAHMKIITDLVNNLPKYNA